MKRDGRVTLLVDEGYRYVSVSWRASEATERDARRDMESLAVRYMGEEEGHRAARKVLEAGQSIS